MYPCLYAVDINSGNFSEASNLQFCPLKATPKTEPRILDDTKGVVASGISILHRFASSHAIVRAFYVPLTQYSTVPSN
jgi:hypothetical protein